VRLNLAENEAWQWAGKLVKTIYKKLTEF
jgi:hypothetical protein